MGEWVGSGFGAGETHLPFPTAAVAGSIAFLLPCSTICPACPAFCPALPPCLPRLLRCALQYWDDPADSVKHEEGTLLPLWSFAAPAARRRAVTALCWSPRYPDLFAVGYGSFDFLHPASGLVACYSLKNPSHPEYSFATSAGVMCLDFHPDHPNLLAVGCYDGGLCIFDVRAAGTLWGQAVGAGRGLLQCKAGWVGSMAGGWTAQQAVFT